MARQMLRSVRILATHPGQLLALTFAAAFFLLFAAQACADTVVFEFTNAEQMFTVPVGVTSLHIVAIGGKGGGAPIKNSSLNGGAGAKATADVVVSPGQALYVEVGGEGSYPVLENGGVGGFNGGANGGDGSFYAGGGGGGASDVRTTSTAAGPTSLNSRLIIAGGGGGAGGGGEFSEGTGGDAGEPGHFGAFYPGAYGGGEGTAGAGGAGAPNISCGPGAESANGAFGIGGKGGSCEYSGGGGGAGLFGGGGGGAGLVGEAYGGGGGGGSSGFGANASNTSVTITSAPASVTIGYTPPSAATSAPNAAPPPNPSGTAASPDTRLSSATVNTDAQKATFKFTGTGQVTGFECALVTKGSPKPKFRGCRSPMTYRNLKPGKYTFEVRAVGPGGPDPTPAKKGFKVKNGRNR